MNTLKVLLLNIRCEFIYVFRGQKFSILSMMLEEGNDALTWCQCEVLMCDRKSNTKCIKVFLIKKHKQYWYFLCSMDIFRYKFWTSGNTNWMFGYLYEWYKRFQQNHFCRKCSWGIFFCFLERFQTDHCDKYEALTARLALSEGNKTHLTAPIKLNN